VNSGASCYTKHMANRYSYTKMQILAKLNSALETSQVMRRGANVGSEEEKEKILEITAIIFDALKKIKEIK
jgi:hypothetical protein